MGKIIFNQYFNVNTCFKQPLLKKNHRHKTENIAKENHLYSKKEEKEAICLHTIYVFTA